MGGWWHFMVIGRLSLGGKGMRDHMSRSWMRLVFAIAGLLVIPLARGSADQLSIQQEQARQAQLRLLCVTIFGGDFTNPLSNLIFKRCLQDPEAMIRQRRPVYMPLHPVPLLGPSTPLIAGGVGKGAGLAERKTSPPDHPPAQRQLLPLAAGVNKGNIVSSDGVRNYFFWAGPGHIRVELAFKEMGVFGAPLRQALSFELLDDHGQIFENKSIISESGLERTEISGDFERRQKLILAVKAQTGLIQMGGYYEIAVIGDAGFDKSAPDTSKIAPKDTRLVKPGVPLITHSQPLLGSSSGLVR
jgi:hypothetical protein